MSRSARSAGTEAQLTLPKWDFGRLEPRRRAAGGTLRGPAGGTVKAGAPAAQGAPLQQLRSHQLGASLAAEGALGGTLKASRPRHLVRPSAVCMSICNSCVSHRSLKLCPQLGASCCWQSQHQGVAHLENSVSTPALHAG